MELEELNNFFSNTDKYKYTQRHAFLRFARCYGIHLITTWNVISFLDWVAFEKLLRIGRKY